MNNDLIDEKKAELKAVRAEIDELDEQICSCLKRRFFACEKIKDAKKFLGLPVTDLSRESAVNEHIAALFESETQKNAAKIVYKSIIESCKAIQNED